jgi:hypothetical protein
LSNFATKGHHSQQKAAKGPNRKQNVESAYRQRISRVVKPNKMYRNICKGTFYFDYKQLTQV